MRASRRVLVGVAVAIVAAGGIAGAVFAAGGGDDGEGEPDDGVRTVQPGAPGDTTRELSEEDAAAIGAPTHTAEDTAFMQDMLVHHAQALEMAALVADRTDSADLPLLAERITTSQEAEIALIEQWLTDRGEPVPHDDDHAAHGLMPGMATPEQLAALEAADGPAFDTLFLDLMIAHHQGALTMVSELYTAGAGLEPAVDAFARGVEADQTIEITRMADMRTSQG